MVHSSIDDFNKSFEDLDLIISKDKNYGIAYFVRASTRLKLIQLLSNFDRDQENVSINLDKTEAEETQSEFSIKEHRIEDVISDLDKALQIDPGFTFAYYNRAYAKATNGDLNSAMEDFSKAIQQNPNFAEALYNRGLIRIYLNDEKSGCDDLSKSGELGVKAAYNVMKRYCFK